MIANEQDDMWGLAAPNYETYTKSLGYFCPEWIARNVSQLNSLAECRVLDLGCGSGLNVKVLSQQRAGIRAEGVDASRGMLEVARATDLYDKLYVYDLSMPLAGISSDRFDLVMLFSVLQLLPDVSTCLSECRRVLKIGGILWATFPYSYAQQVDDIEPPQSVHQAKVQISGYSTAQIVHMIGRAGMQLTELKPIVEHVTPNGLPVPCYLLQSHKN